MSNIAARYSLDGSASDSTYRVGSGTIPLIADRSGNSAVNGLVLPGSSGNYVSAPNSTALNVGANFVLLWDGILNDWTPSALAILIAKWNSGASKRQYEFGVNTDGTISVFVSADGGAVNFTELKSSVAPTVTNLSRLAIRVDYVGAGASATFYTATTSAGPWTQLGTVATGTARTPFSSDAILEVGSTATGTGGNVAGICYRAKVIDGTFAGGTVVWDSDFTRLPKTLTNGATFAEFSSNAATCTLNSSGDTGARICGARDRVQLTVAKQPAFSTSNGINIATYDGSNDYTKSAPFPLSQPTSVYLTGSQVSWTGDDRLLDGNSSTERLIISQAAAGASPQLQITNNVCTNGGLAVGSLGVICAVYNGSASSLGINKGASVTGDALTSNANGVTVGCAYNQTLFGNMTETDLLIRSAADSEAVRPRIADFYMRKNHIPG